MTHPAPAPLGTPDERRAAFREGVRDFLPVTPAIVAWGLVTGVALVQSGLTLAQALGLSATAFAGSAQLAVLPLIAGSAPVWIIVTTALMMNLRFVIYSAALKRSLEHLSFCRRLLLGYLTGDVGFVLYLRRVQTDPDWRPRDAYFLGMAWLNWCLWHVASLVGIFAAAWLPREWGFEFAGMLALVALLVPLCARLPGAVGTVVAAGVGIVTLHWPARSGLLVAIVAGVVAAVLAERARAPREAGP